MDNHTPRYLYDFGDYQEIIAKLLEIDCSQILDTLSARVLEEAILNWSGKVNMHLIRS